MSAVISVFDETKYVEKLRISVFQRNLHRPEQRSRRPVEAAVKMRPPDTRTKSVKFTYMAELEVQPHG